MNTHQIILFLGLLIVSQVNSISLLDLFNDWATEYRMAFSSNAHRSSVFSKWVDNHKYIQFTNSQNLSYTLGHNQFSGMSLSDYSEYNNLASYSAPRIRLYLRNLAVSANIPASIDWTTLGAVTPVKDQGQCGSCWSFSTTGALEGAYAVANGQLVSFSEQQLVDCDTFSNGGRDHGCNGGLMDNAFAWIGKNNGLCTEQEYPYVSGTTKTAGTCAQKSCAVVAGSDIHSYVDVVPRSDSAMMEALAKQPVSVAIEADQRDFQLYSSGVFTGSCGTNLDHGVLVVGYGTMNGADYYKVKNSWSSTWGDEGYIYLGRGDNFNGGAGQCGVLLQASYPVL
jgi:KDEL-tailed cysteine endopeptidase